jgi:hypothetical protein
MKEYQVKISRKFAGFENLNGSEDINKENIWTSAEESLSLYKLKEDKLGLMKMFKNFRSKEAG